MHLGYASSDGFGERDGLLIVVVVRSSDGRVSNCLLRGEGEKIFSGQGELTHDERKDLVLYKNPRKDIDWKVSTSLPSTKSSGRRCAH